MEVKKFIFDVKMLPWGGKGVRLLNELGILKKLKSYSMGPKYFYFEFTGTAAACSALHTRLNEEQGIFKIIGVHTEECLTS